MGENIKTKEQHSTADTLRDQIRHTEGHISETVHSLEERLSPRYLRQRGTRQAKRLAWEATAKVLELAQRTSLQASLVAGSAFWMLIKKTRLGEKLAASKPKPAVRERRRPGTASMAAGATALGLLSRKANARDNARVQSPARKPLSGILLAATAAQAFLSGARSSVKSGTTRPGRKMAWRGLATAIGAALGSYWYSHRGRRV